MATGKPSPRQIVELRQLIARLCDDALTPEEATRLEELICTDSACCEYYATVMHIDATLPRYLGGTTPGLSALLSGPCQSDGLSAEAAIEGALKRAVPAMPATVLAPAAEPIHESPKSRFTRLTTRSRFPVLFAAASVVLVAVLVVSNRKDASRPGLGTPAIVENSTTSSGYPSFKSVRLQSGSVRLGIDRVGWVQVDGPTDFALIGPMRARLNYGRIQMRVTEKTGHGFVVETPDGEVVDLGTEFALHVAQGADTRLIVHEGEVDLRPGNSSVINERLVGGEAVTFNISGSVERLMSIIAPDNPSANEQKEPAKEKSTPLIVSVSDNLSTCDTKGYYQIVPQGLQEDAFSNVDSRHEWNGVDANGIPAYLLGADYVRTFNSRKKQAKANLTVELSRPAKLYIFWWDEDEPPREWLVRDFRPTGDHIGLDANDRPRRGPKRRRGVGPGQSIDLVLSVWVREITTPGTVLLGADLDPSIIGKYGIAAVELETNRAPDSATEKSPQ